MICVAVARPGYAACVEAIEHLEFAEIRLDAAGLSLDETRRLFSLGKKLIATFRPGQVDEAVRVQTLVAAVGAGATYVDIEVEAAEDVRRTVIEAARGRKCQVIVSHHDFEKTPGRGELDQIVTRCFAAGADIAKVACRVQSERESARLLGLLDTDRRVVVVGMGEKGIITRVTAALLGAPFTFAALALGEETAPGQLDYGEMRGLLRALGWKG